MATVATVRSIGPVNVLTAINVRLFVRLDGSHVTGVGDERGRLDFVAEMGLVAGAALNVVGHGRVEAELGGVVARLVGV